jgi:hypothetical protein
MGIKDQIKKTAIEKTTALAAREFLEKTSAIA